MANGRRLVHVAASIGIVLVLLIGGWATVGLAAPADHALAGVPPAGSPGTAETVAAHSPGSARLPSGGGVPAPPPPVVRQVEHAIAQSRIDPRDVFLPSSLTHVGSSPAATISPRVTSVPAPMGLSDLGLGPGTTYSYSSTGFAATLSLAAFSAFSPGYPATAESPNWTTIQLNTVATNISVPNLADGTFWIQNVAHFNGATIQFEDNIWNFSSPNALLPANGIMAGSNGSVFENEFYYAFGPAPCAVTYPFTLTLYNNLTTVKVLGIPHPVVYFNYTTSSAGCLRGSYDRVVFSGAVSHPPAFEVNGATYNPFGLLYDAEIIVGGDGGGSNANIQTLNGTVGLSSWNNTTKSYQHVPSAYDFGPDTGETSLGVAGYYTGTGGVEHLNQGPSMLYGLWNTSSRGFAPSALTGFIHIAITVSPDYAFLFATSSASYHLALAQANLSYVPSNPAGLATTDLPPVASGSYAFAAWADGYTSGAVYVASQAMGTQTLTLNGSASVLDAPVYVSSASQISAYGAAKIPTVGWASSNGTLWLNASNDALAAPFLRLNDFGYPTFVLVASDGVNSAILVNGFVQDPTTFSYTSYNQTVSIPGWTQGYYFFGGTGLFSVANTALVGNTTRYYGATTPIVSAAAVEFYGTTGSRATGVTASQDSNGVTVVNSTGAIVSHLTGETGAEALTALYATTITATSLAAIGSDAFGFPSRAAVLGNDSHVTMSAVSASGGSFGVDLANVTHWIDTGLSVRSGSFGLMAQYSSFGSLSGTVVQGASTAGSLSNSTSLSITGLLVEGSFGLNLVTTTSVTGADITVFGNTSLGVPATGIAEFNNSTGGTFTALSAVNLSIAFNATNSSYVNLTTVNATNGSVGATLSGVSHVRVIGLEAANQSIALSWQVGASGVIDGGALGNSSVGVTLANVTGVSVSGLAANESFLAPPYFFSPATGQDLPTTPVAFDNVTNAFVGNITANEYPFGLWANFTKRTTIYNVTATDGGVGVIANVTDWVNLSEVFAYGNVLGVVLFNATANNLTSSTIEDSRGWGIAVENSTNLNVLGNNFVANNNSSASGVFLAAHDQAYTNNSTAVHFSTTVGNYWADYSGSGAYPIHNDTGGDAHPYSAFLYNYLKFVARGLPGATPWGVIVRGVNFSSLDPLFYIPSYALPVGTFPFTVNQTPGYLPSPARGTVDFTGADQTITITYTAATYSVVFVASGLPLGKSWSVTFGGVTQANLTSGSGDSISFEVANGTYSYSITEPAGWVQYDLPTQGGSITVAGADLSYTLHFVPYTYAVTFTEKHLAVGTTWSVTLGGVPKSGTGATFVFQEPNGTYTYSVGAIAGWNETTIPFSGSVRVQGGVVALIVAWAPIYRVTFTETGLPTGSPWSISLNGTTQSSTGTTIVFNLTNASYGYSMPPVGNLSAPGGHVTVDGSPVSVSILFAPTPPSTSPGFPWLYVGVGLGAVAVVAAIGALLLRRRGRAGATPPPSDEPDRT